jgi:SAM-dependent methyltransferase
MDNFSNSTQVTQDYIFYQGLRLPPKNLRWGGPRYLDDEFYMKSSENRVKLLADLCGFSKNSRVLDIGCGQGCLLTGILSVYGEIKEYVGLDVHQASIDWTSKNLSSQSPPVSFKLLNIFNERYNPDGEAITKEVHFPVPDRRFDTIVLVSVFSHMRLKDIQAYLKEIERVLAVKGKVFLTLFVEHGVPEEEENPIGYHRDWSGALHCIRINRYTFEDMIYNSGLIINYFRYRHTSDGQSSYILSLKEDSPFQAKVFTT